MFHRTRDTCIILFHKPEKMNHSYGRIILKRILEKNCLILQLDSSESGQVGTSSGFLWTSGSIKAGNIYVYMYRLATVKFSVMELMQVVSIWPCFFPDSQV